MRNAYDPALERIKNIYFDYEALALVVPLLR
jgi:hypothetical protein